jgi:metallo-beta-lactamase family protein
MHLQFQGAARTVTGSMHMVTVGGLTILLDCGTFHGRRGESVERNNTFPFQPSTISAVVLSHAHIDHSGNLPTLVKQGFRGPIFCTPATQSLCEVMLRDSAFIQEKDAEYISKKRRHKNLPPIMPLYTEDDVDATIKLFSGVQYSETFEVTEGITCRFEDAGHILGSASVALLLREGTVNVRLAFTGDLGRPHLPILRDPVFIDDGEGTDYLISESTYGGRFHSAVTEMKDQLLGPLLRATERRGKVIIPAFSVGRTQEIVYMLHILHQEGKLQKIPVYVDSPLSVNVTEVFRNHPECFDDETLAILFDSENNDPFGFANLTYIRDVEESKKLNEAVGPCIIIAASGMCEAGRVLHHLANSIGNPKNMVLIAGYQAENTLGKKLVLKEPEVNIFGEPHTLRAEVVVLNSYSGHADRNELLAYIRQFDRRQMRQVFLVHGDLDQAEMLSAGLHGAGFEEVSIPVRGQKADLS